MLKSKQAKYADGNASGKEVFYTDSYRKRPAFGYTRCVRSLLLHSELVAVQLTMKEERSSCFGLFKFPSDKTLSNQWNELYTTFEGGNVTKICLKSVTEL